MRYVDRRREREREREGGRERERETDELCGILQEETDGAHVLQLP